MRAMKNIRSPLGLGLVIGGALLLALAAFLPFQESSRFVRVEQNTLIQNGAGWGLVIGAVIIAALGYRVAQRLSDKTVGLTVVSIGALVGVILTATDKDLRTLYPVNPFTGQIDNSVPGIVSALGIVIYVAGAGAVMAIVGSVMLRNAIQAEQGIDETHETETPR
jgi:membrane protease YdiL (CAAX protease family)